VTRIVCHGCRLPKFHLLQKLWGWGVKWGQPANQLANEAEATANRTRELVADPDFGQPMTGSRCQDWNSWHGGVPKATKEVHLGHPRDLSSQSAGFVFQG
jgi:hypothetical protein